MVLVLKTILLKNVRKTYISSWLGFYADADGNTVQNAKLEGVCVNGDIDVKYSENLTIAKCQFFNLIMEGSGVDGLLVHNKCYLTGGVNGRNYYIGNMIVKNCYISGQIVNLTSRIVKHCLTIVFYVIILALIQIMHMRPLFTQTASSIIMTVIMKILLLKLVIQQKTVFSLQMKAM